MSFFESIGKALHSTWTRISLPVSNKKEIGKINQEIEEKKQELADVYASIGRSYFANHQADEAAEERDKFRSVEMVSAELNARRNALEHIQQVNTCENCSARMAPDAVECPVCGAAIAGGNQMPRDITCPYCGQVSQQTDVCTLCGANLAGVIPGGTPAMAQKAARNKTTGMITFFAGLLAAAAVCLLIFLGVKGIITGTKGNTPEGRVEAFIVSTINGRYDQSMEMIYPDVIDYFIEDEGISRRDFNNNVKRISGEYAELLKNEDVDLKDVTIKVNIDYMENLDEESLAECQASYREELGVEVTDAKILDGEVTLYHPELGEDSVYFSGYRLVKIDGKWWLHPTDPDPFSDFSDYCFEDFFEEEWDSPVAEDTD
ncbi:MAG: zinc ribbon domain-containing protein [Clostridiales bacterium]|nr:zinc ribbon domain-containing protein [Clostridiales bacterium]